MIRSQSRRKSLRVALDGSEKSRPRLCPGSDAKGARARPNSTAMGLSLARYHAPIDQFRRATYLIGGGPVSRTVKRRRPPYWNDSMETVTVTERAVRRIGEILRSEPEGTMLRVSVEGGGCSGFQYKFDMDRAQAPDDLLITRAGARVLIDQVSLGYLTGSEIDFVDDLIGASFRINNPNAKASCGCGTSFTL